MKNLRMSWAPFNTEHFENEDSYEICDEEERISLYNSYDVDKLNYEDKILFEKITKRIYLNIELLDQIFEELVSTTFN